MSNALGLGGIYLELAPFFFLDLLWTLAHTYSHGEVFYPGGLHALEPPPLNWQLLGMLSAPGHLEYHFPRPPEADLIRIENSPTMSHSFLQIQWGNILTLSLLWHSGVTLLAVLLV